MNEETKPKSPKKKASRLRNVNAPNLEGSEIGEPAPASSLEDTGGVSASLTQSADEVQHEFALADSSEEASSSTLAADQETEELNQKTGAKVSPSASPSKARKASAGEESAPANSHPSDLFDEELSVLWCKLKENIQDPRKMKLLAGQEVDIWMQAVQNRSIDEVKELTLGRVQGARRLVGRLAKDLRNRWPGSN